MKKLKLSFWLAVATIGMFAIQLASPLTHHARFDDPLPTCPPDCPCTPPNCPKPPVNVRVH